MAWPKLGIGVGLRPQHYSTILKHWPVVDWFEVITENYLTTWGRPRFILHQIREHYPIVLHGVSLSIGSTDPLDRTYLKQLKLLIKEIDPALVSDHCCWTKIGGEHLHDLYPLPFTEEALQRVVANVKTVQEILERPILLENVSSYLTFSHSQMSEWDFLNTVADASGCGILLDVNNIYVSSFNHGWDPRTYLQGIHPKHVGQFHMAGHTRHPTFLFDTHQGPIIPEVWSLYREALAIFGPVSTLIEWDEAIPDFDTLLNECAIARDLHRTYKHPHGKTHVIA